MAEKRDIIGIGLTSNLWETGNNLVITIPKTVAEKYGLSKGDLISLEVTGIA